VPDGYVITPFGYFHPSCVRHLAEGDNLLADGRIVQHAKGSLTNLPACDYPHYTARGEMVAADAKAEPPTITHSWIVYGGTTTSTSYGEISATWTVPSAPTSNNGQTLYFFPGLEDFNDIVSILQPVLGWNADFSGAWGIASWNCCPSGTADESSPVHVLQGDIIFGDVKSTCSAGTLSCSKWNVTTEDDSSTPISRTTLSNTPNEGQTFNWAFGGALEVYNVAQCSNYPPNDSLNFNVALYDNNFHLTSNGWSITDLASGLTPQCNYGGQAAGGGVTLVFGNGASVSPASINFGTWDINHPPVNRTVTLTNYETSTISITSIGGLDGNTFSVTSKTCGSTLAAGASCSITITLTPANAGGAGTVIETLSVVDSAPNSPQKVTLTGKITCSHSC
jgi:hypothetical protein